MLKATQILVSASALGACAVILAGCGQRGPLYLPTTPAAQSRATLPQTLNPMEAAAPADSASAAQGASR